VYLWLQQGRREATMLCSTPFQLLYVVVQKSKDRVKVYLERVLVQVQVTERNAPLNSNVAHTCNLDPYLLRATCILPIFKYNLITSAKLVQSPDSLLIPLGFSNPESFPILHDISQNSTSEEDHVFSPWRIFDTDLEVLPVSQCLELTSRHTFSLEPSLPRTLVR